MYDGLDRAINGTIHEIADEIIDISISRDRPEIMRQYITTIKNKSIAVKHPEKVKEWDTERNDGLTADMVSANSNVKYWCLKKIILNSLSENGAILCGFKQGCYNGIRYTDNFSRGRFFRDVSMAFVRFFIDVVRGILSFLCEGIGWNIAKCKSD